MKTLKIFAIALSVIYLSGCVNSTGQAGATENEICRQWGHSLPTRSHSDTEQTKGEIQEAYAAFSLACPEWSHLVPL